MQTEVVVVQPVCPESKNSESVAMGNHCCDRIFLKNPVCSREGLIHGASVVPPDQLYLSEHGFDFYLSSQKARWGTRTYFTTCAKYSDKYTHRILGTTHKQYCLLQKCLQGNHMCACDPRNCQGPGWPQVNPPWQNPGSISDSSGPYVTQI